MEFRNLTAFHAHRFATLDGQGQERCAIVIKTGYRLVPGDGGQCVVQPLADPPALCANDIFHGEEGQSSIREESDYAPFKPHCDVLIHGHAHAPEGKPTRRWTARVRITQSRKLEEIPDPAPPQPLNQVMELTNDQLADWARAKRKVAQQRERAAAWAAERDVLLDKRLHVTGPRWFKRGFLRLWLRWRLTRPKRATKVPLRWEHAFGGRSVLPNPKHQKNPKKPEYLLYSECYSNPVGCGWIDKRHFRKSRKAGRKRPWTLPAPQLYYPFRPIRRLRRARPSKRNLTASKMARIARRYPTPAGFGPIGRAWAPRLALAGTFDERWQEERWPALPEDFDFGYWNGAPPDQQIPHPSPDLRLELWGLTDARYTPGGYLCADLPPHRVFVLLRFESGQLVPAQPVIDTVRIDTDAMTVSLTHRLWLDATAPVRVAEARLEVDPAAPLLKRKTSSTTYPMAAEA